MAPNEPAYRLARANPELRSEFHRKLPDTAAPRGFAVVVTLIAAGYAALGKKTANVKPDEGGNSPYVFRGGTRSGCRDSDVLRRPAQRGYARTLWVDN